MATRFEQIAESLSDYSLKIHIADQRILLGQSERVVQEYMEILETFEREAEKRGLND